MVSVAGFDDISVAALTAPTLSTVRLPLRELGQRGYAHALRQLSGQTVGPELLPTEVVIRASIGPPV
jgi:LacI family transcriptional regulator